MKIKTTAHYAEPHKCSRCGQHGETVHMVSVLGSLVHPMCAVALVGEDGLARMPYDAIKNIRRSDVGDRIIRKLLDHHA